MKPEHTSWLTAAGISGTLHVAVLGFLSNLSIEMPAPAAPAPTVVVMLHAEPEPEPVAAPSVAAPSVTAPPVTAPAVPAPARATRPPLPVERVAPPKPMARASVSSPAPKAVPPTLAAQEVDVALEQGHQDTASASAPNPAASPSTPVAATAAGEPATEGSRAGSTYNAAMPGSGTAVAGTGRAEPVMTTVHYRQPPQPVYPPQARRLGEQGQVRVKVRVAIDGIPGDAVVVESSGSPRLDQAAVQAVLAARFEPLRIDGRPQAALAIVPIHFSLQ